MEKNDEITLSEAKRVTAEKSRSVSGRDPRREKECAL